MNQRTIPQNNALHKYFEQVAEALNNAGLDTKKTIQLFRVDIPWTTVSVKEVLWKTIQRSMLGKSSTTELDRLGEIEKCWEVLNRFLGERGIESIPFPSIQGLINKK